MTETTKRILDLMEQKNVNAHQLEVAIGLPNASIQGWVKGKKKSDGTTREFSPSTDSIAKLARYFNVSADYLLGLTDERKPLSSIKTDIMERPRMEIAEPYQQLLGDADFLKIAQVYASVQDAIKKGILIGAFLAAAKSIGVDTSVVGY